MWSTTDDVDYDDDDDITRSAKVTREIRANNGGGGVSREGGGGAASVRRSPRPLQKALNLELTRIELLVSLKLLEDEETLLNEASDYKHGSRTAGHSVTEG